MITAFRDKHIEDSFVHNGFATFPFLSDEQLDEIRGIYAAVNRADRLNKEQFYGVNYSLGTLDAKENENLVKQVLAVIDVPLKKHFIEYEVFGCVFITKPPHTRTTFVYHQDWSYTDEKNHAFATCWIPLFDTSKSNGCMSVIEGTHRYFNTYRSDTLESARIEFEEIPEDIRTDVEQKAGTCLAFHQAIFHGSYPNVSDFGRPVFAFVVKHRNSPVVHYVHEGNTIGSYQLSVTSFNQMLTQIPKSDLPSDSIQVARITRAQPILRANDIVAAFRILNPNHRLIKDFEAHEYFHKNGFTILRNVVDSKSIDELRKLYKENFNTPQGMYVTHHAEKDIKRNKTFSDKIFEMLNDIWESIFLNYKPLIAHYAVKKGGNDGLFNLHQDWSIVREELYGVLHCWIPLQDVNKENGTLAVLPQSHLCFHNYRSGTCPIRFLPFDAFEKKVLHIEAKAGDVVLYHPALFHGSEANKSEVERLALVAAITHPLASKVYHHDIDGEIWAYEMTDEDLFGRLDDLAKGAESIGRKMFAVQNRKLTITDSEVIETLQSYCVINPNLDAEV